MSNPVKWRMKEDKIRLASSDGIIPKERQAAGQERAAGRGREERRGERMKEQFPTEDTQTEEWSKQRNLTRRTGRRHGRPAGDP